MKYVIDIDGTICTNTNGKYEEALPYTDRIEYINELFSQGNYIVYHTARGMNTFLNDQTAANKKWYDVTEKQLNDWGAKYHKLILGKPSGDFYIDDKGVYSNDFFLRIHEHLK